MEHLNKTELRGNVGRVHRNDNAINFTLATNYAYEGSDGYTIIETTWHDVALFVNESNKADAEKLTKGANVYVCGRIRNQKYTDANGLNCISTFIIANKLEVIDNSVHMCIECQK